MLSRVEMVTISYFSVFFVVTGCGDSTRPEVVPVSGVVTLDGAPLPKATVVFIPRQAGLKPSRAITDEAGHFELTYLREIKGAVPGEHEVRVTTRTEHQPQERVPGRYNSESELRVTVEDGGAPVQLDLKSQ